MKTNEEMKKMLLVHMNSARNALIFGAYSDEEEKSSFEYLRGMLDFAYCIGLINAEELNVWIHELIEMFERRGEYK